MAFEDRLDEIKMETGALYREDVYTDRKVGTIRKLTPVTKTGDTDLARPVLYLGETQILTPMGALPISFEIPASSIGEAAENFGARAKEAVEQTMRELQELRREAASQIVVPDAATSSIIAKGGLGGQGRGGGGGIIRP
ncbi:MAG: hypothetical protein ACWGSD_09290 [Thermodesulfobacteriota bacterium]